MSREFLIIVIAFIYEYKDWNIITRSVEKIVYIYEYKVPMCYNCKVWVKTLWPIVYMKMSYVIRK